MNVAELEVFHSRPVAPTRRVALGHLNLPVDPPPGFGGVLLGGIVARHTNSLDPELVPDLHRLTLQLEVGQTITQPRLRHRFQHDTVGLQRSTHRLVGEGDSLRYSFDDGTGTPSQQLLGAVYAAGQLPQRARGPVMRAIRMAIGWQGPVGPALIAALAGFRSGVSWSARTLSHPVEWALGILGFDVGEPNGNRDGNGTAGAARYVDLAALSPGQVQKRYRKLLIEAHPDHGGRSDAAAQRIADLAEARRILLDAGGATR